MVTEHEKDVWTWTHTVRQTLTLTRARAHTERPIAFEVAKELLSLSRQCVNAVHLPPHLNPHSTKHEDELQSPLPQFFEREIGPCV